MPLQGLYEVTDVCDTIVSVPVYLLFIVIQLQYNSLLSFRKARVVRSSAITPYHLQTSFAERSLDADSWAQKLSSVPVASIA